jgi:hypothetical protein
VNDILPHILAEFRKTKSMAERAMAQVGDEQLFVRMNPRQNSIAAIVRHMAGNMRSRFTDFLTTDGEKPWRHRDGEFDDRPAPRAELMEAWERGWRCVFDAIEPLAGADLSRVVTIRTEPHKVFQAINRQTAHYAYHVGQILLIAKHLKGEGWNHLTIAPGETGRFNREMGMTPPPPPPPNA